MPKINEQKHLGLILDSKSSFQSHLNVKIIKAKKRYWNLQISFEILTPKTLDQMYKVLIHLDYCDTIYNIPTLNSQTNLGVTLISLMEKVERTQYQAALAGTGITGTWQGSNRSKLYAELGLETISDRRCCRRILQIHKIKRNMIVPTSETNYI